MSADATLGAERRVIEERDVSVSTFVATNAEYYGPVFERIQRRELPRWHMNIWGALIPWLWSGYRGVWLMFWLALAIDVFAVVCLMQVVKFTPLLEVALQNETNVTLIERYGR